MLKKTTGILSGISVLLLLIISTTYANEQVNIPGTSTILSRYLNFYYNLPSKDFIYHLNDMLIFSEAPTNKIFKRSVREKLGKIIVMEKKIESLIKTRFLFEKNLFTINLSTRKGFRDASKLLNYLGLYLEKKDSGMYSIEEDDSTGIVDYYKFVNLRVRSLERLLNRTNRLFYNHTNSTMEIPFSFEFLNNATGLDINKNNFLDIMTNNKKFSIFLGILYRLSENDINYISRLSSKGNTWRTIYNDKLFLIGMFNLSTSIRTSDGKLNLPGGIGSAPFWSSLAGVPYTNEDISFLRAIATKDGGKLNYLYVFSFFLPESKLKPLLFDLDIKKMGTIYSLITLKKNEDLAENRFPRLRKQGFFNLLYALNVFEGNVKFPGDIRDWIRMLGGKVPSVSNNPINSEKELYFHFIKTLLSKKTNNSKISPVSKFISIYSKFYKRGELLNGESLKLFYNKYNKYNVLIDYIEKIKVKDVSTVTDLFSWVKSIEKLEKNDRILFTAIYQSLFEILSFSSKYNPNGYDYDKLTTDLISIPPLKSKFIDKLIEFFKTDLKINVRKQYINNRFFGFLLNGIENNIINLYNSEYELMNRNIFKTSINNIISSQEVINLSTLSEFNELFNRIPSQGNETRKSSYKKIVELFLRLPHPEISDEAPRFIRMRVMAYKRSELNRDLKRLKQIVSGKNSTTELKKLISKFRNKYLFPHLKNYLVTIAYALNAKTDRLRIFINPNLVRLHDFEYSEKNTPWNYSGRPDSSLSAKTIPGFRLKGGLSRLNIIFASVWKDQMLAGNIIFDKELIESVFYNLFNMYPYSKLKYYPEYASLLINFGVELLNRGNKDTYLKQQLLNKTAKILSGNIYKNVTDYLEGKTKKPLLFYDHYFKIGKVFCKNKKILNTFFDSKKLKKYLNNPLKQDLRNEEKWFGNIYFKTLGTLNTGWKEFFPLEVGNLFKSGAVNGEIFREFKMKISYLSNTKKYPPLLQGHFLFNYLTTTFPRYYQQNYDKDYYTTFFIFNILNNSNLSRIIKRYQRKGYVRLR